MTSIRMAWLIGVVLVAATLLYASSFPAEQPGGLNWLATGYHPTIGSQVFGGVAILCASCGPWRPQIAVLGMTLVGFGIARYQPQLEYAWTSGFQSCVIAIGCSGIAFNKQARLQMRAVWDRKSFGLILLLALGSWTLIGEAMATLSGAFDAGQKHHFFRMLESVSLAMAMMAVINGQRWCHVVVLTAIGSQCLVLLQIDELTGASDVAFSTAPLACLLAGIALATPWAMALGLGGATLSLATVSLYTANRGANIGLGVGMVALLFAALTRLKHLVFALLMTGAAVALALKSPLVPRLDEWIEQGWKTPTLESRMRFWNATLETSPARLWIGWGPGRGGQAMSDRLELSRWTATHNSVLEMLDEQGIVGVALWVTLVATVFNYAVTLRRSDRRWMRGIGLGTICALAAILVGGLTFSRHDDIRFFWLIGLVLGVKAVQVRCERESAVNRLP